jgi:hypothetical protein
MQSVLNVDKNVKFHSSLMEEDQFTVESVMLNEDHREEIDTKLTRRHLFFVKQFLSQFFSLITTYRIRAACMLSTRAQL